ncbi:MAG TPA: hypothetical protein ENN19_17335 [Chloroflexi bacterium]|nr:hypothetical protein [Chloroflexota bacterium]
MSIIRLHFEDINNQSLGDLEVSQDVPVKDMLPLIVQQLGLGEEDCHLILEQNRAIDPQFSFGELGARDGSVIRVMAARVVSMPLLQEVQFTITGTGTQVQDARQTRHIHGRKQEITAITRSLEQHRDVLVVGPPGIGKSHLLRYTRDHLLAPDAAIYLDGFKSAKAALRTVARTLHQRRHLTLRDGDDSETVYRKLGNWQTDDIVTLVCDALYSRGYVLIVDDLDMISLAEIPILQELTQVATILAAASSDNLGALTPIMGNFSRVELDPLPDDEIRTILWTQVDRDGLARPEKLEEKVLKKVQGNPGAIGEVVARLREGGAYLNPVWILGVAILLAVTLYFVGQATNGVMAFLSAIVVVALCLVLRVVLWKPSYMVKQ